MCSVGLCLVHSGMTYPRLKLIYTFPIFKLLYPNKDGMTKNFTNFWNIVTPWSYTLIVYTMSRICCYWCKYFWDKSYTQDCSFQAYYYCTKMHCFNIIGMWLFRSPVPMSTLVLQVPPWERYWALPGAALYLYPGDACKTSVFNAWWDLRHSSLSVGRLWQKSWLEKIHMSESIAATLLDFLESLIVNT